MSHSFKQHERRMPAALQAVFLCAALLMALTSAGCGSNGSSGGDGKSAPTPTTGTPATFAVKITDSAIIAGSTTVPAGQISFDALNNGTKVHELNFAQTDFPADDLPLKSNGDVDEKAKGMKIFGVIPELPVGVGEVIQFGTPPGNYVLFCNIHGHYKNGETVGFTAE